VSGLLTAGAAVSLLLPLLFAPTLAATAGADLDLLLLLLLLLLLGRAPEDEMRPTGESSRDAVHRHDGTVGGAKVAGRRRLVVRGHGDWFQPELAVVAAQHTRLKHKTGSRVTEPDSGYPDRPVRGSHVVRVGRIRMDRLVEKWRVLSEETC